MNLTTTTITTMILLMGVLRGPPYPKGVHFPPIEDFDRQLERFEDGAFITSLTPGLQSGAGLVTLNTFVHAVDLKVGNFFDVSASHITAKMREYTGEPSHLNPQKIPSALVGNEIGCKVARFRRVSDSKESPNGLAPVVHTNRPDRVYLHPLSNSRVRS